MKRSQRELQEMVEKAVRIEFAARDSVDVGSLDEDVDSLADEMSTIRYEFKVLKHEFVGIRIVTAMLSMLAIAWGIYGIIGWFS